jgi:hypothetical protein
LRNRRDLDDLRTNPMLLTALCVKFNEGKQLPEDIHDQYDAVVNQVLYNRYRDRQWWAGFESEMGEPERPS